MKKILSILICVVLGISSAWADQYTHTINVYARNGNVSTEGGGTVTAQGGYYGDIDVQWNDGAVKSSTTTVFSTSTTTEEQSYWAIVTKWKTGKFQMTATPFAGYYFSHWTGNTANSTSTLSGWSQSTGWKTIEKQGSAKTFYYYAIFKPIGISNASAATISTVDYPSSNTVTVSFPVTNADNINDFQTPTVTGEGFSIDSYSYANNTVSVIVRFTNFNKDNVNGTSKPTFAGTVTLKSAGGENSGICTITATSDLTPEFTATPSPCDLTPNDPVEDGHTVNATINTSFTKTITGNANNVWSAYFTNPTQATNLGYSLDATDPKNPKVSFSPTAQSINKPNIETQLCIKCVYTDATPKEVPYVLTITLSADAGKVFTINTLKEAMMNFAVIDYSATNNPATMTFPIFTTMEESDFTRTENLTGGVTIATTIAGLASTTDKIDVTAPSTTTPGEYISTVRYQETDGDLWAQLTINVPIKLAKPVVSATTNLGQAIQLNWQEVYGATGYVVEGKKEGDANFVTLTTIGDDETIATTYTVNHRDGMSMLVGTNYTFRITAVYAPNNFGNRISDELTIAPSVPTTITAADVPVFELYTGTEIFVEGNSTYGVFPYRKKRAIDLAAAFSPAGAPLFDRLYIFGLTSSAVTTTVSGQTGHKITPANASKGSDAITPCYVYVKNGNQYDLQQTIPNMNVTNKPISDVSGTSQGVKVYLTGYCPYASTGGGNNKNENGIICFTGGAGDKVDVYVDDVQLYARYKSKNGNTSTPDTVLFSGLQTSFRCVGTSTAFAFKGTSSDSGNPFQPTIHMRDSNRLSGNTGSAVKVDIKVNIPLVGEKGMTQTAGQYNSPIGLLTDEDKRYTTLSIDDIWPASMVDNASGDVRTNGFLDIRTTTAAPCIDLYDQYGKVNFNGGRIYMKNSRPSGSNNYLCTFSVGYRMYSKTVEIASVPITATMYGLGTDQSGGEVNFNDGSFYIDPLTDTEFTKHGEYYHHKYALKCPASSTINGGTYYCEPFGCTESKNKGASPLNKYGDGLVLDTVAVESLLEPYKTAVINFPNDKEVQAEYAATYPTTLGEYYTAKGGTYGISSLNAYQGTQAPDSVILMLPVQYTDKALQKEVANVSWALCVPDVLAGGSIAVGGDTEVADKEENNVIYQTNYLLYGAIDEYITGLIDGGTYQTPEFAGLPSAEVELNGGTYSNILNEEPYTIQQEQYMMMSVKADEWFLFAPPFDISAVYVIETAVETELKTMAKNEGWQAAINKQAAANMDLFYALCYLIDYTESVNNFDGVFYSWKTELKPAGAGGQVKLTHFTGSNWDKANYYVQRSSGTWEWDAEKERFVTDWKYLPETMEKVTHGETEYSVVMKKGEIYSLNFPYMYNGYREKNGEGNFNWDYWTGKYILFVGKGPQTIEGKNYHQTITESMKVSPGYAEIRANSTFASMEVSDMGEYYLNDQLFIPNTSGEPTPVDATQGFVLLNKPTNFPMPQRIKSIDLISGDVTLEGGDGTATGTPTIAGNNKMLVYSIDGGVGIVPVVAQQVRIYNAAGQVVTSQYLTSETQIPLPTGIYLVTGEKEQCKVMVK